MAVSAQFSRFEIQLDRRQLTEDGKPVHLTPKAFDLLWLLIDAAPRVVSKNEIHARLWPGGVVSDATVVGMVKEIRRALSDTSADLPVLRTVHRVGYAIDVPVVRQMAQPPGGDHWLVAGKLRVALVAGENIIGRDPGLALWLDHPTISRRHARVSLQATRALLEDLDSKNGTSFRGSPVSGPVTLRGGDEFLCGEVLVTYQHSSAVPPTATLVGSPGVRRRG